MIKAKVWGWYWQDKLIGFKWECGDDICRRKGGGRGYDKKHLAWYSSRAKMPALERAIAGATQHIRRYHRDES